MKLFAPSSRIYVCLWAFLVGAFSNANRANACDLCSIYTCLEAKGPAGGFYGGAFLQYTDFSTLRRAGKEVDNEDDQFVHSSITQTFLGYQFNRRFGLQANVPYIRRSFKRPEHDAIEEGRTTGIGDVAVVAHWRLVERVYGESMLVWTLIGGLKLPTGDSDFLGEEAEEGEEEQAIPKPALPAALRHVAHGDESGVHGHDLALGSGSVDGIIGASGFWGRRRLYANFSAQYALRRKGDYDYRYADDLNWIVEPGYFAWLSHHGTLGIGASFLGEHKGQDELAGTKLDDTSITALYLGPALSYTQESRFAAEIAIDLPLKQDNSSLQIVPDYRLRLGVTGRF